MPLHRIAAAEAVAIRKENPNATWGSRGGNNRVEPVAKPAFEAPFRLTSGEPIFTVGSCFARNVETDLMARGYRVPMRELLQTETFRGFAPEILNNYSAPSIYNELAWALGEQPFDQEVMFYETAPGKWVDINSQPKLRPSTREVLLERRAAIAEAYQLVRECRVVIITLGLVEVWYDKLSCTYLNAAPRPGMIKDQPDRFELHVLSFEEADDYLSRTLNLLKEKGHPKLRVLLTVSPVPLTATHRKADVIVANAYSKSCLRTAAESAVAKFDFVAYFPSYESFILSDRRLAWTEDLIHPNRDLVSLNVARMLAAYTGDEQTTAESLRAAGPLAVAEHAARMRAVGGEDADKFFETFRELVDIPEFAVEYAQHLSVTRRRDGAERVYAQISDWQPERVSVLRARNLMASRGDAVAILEPVAANTDSSDVHRTLIAALCRGGDIDAAVQAGQRFIDKKRYRARNVPVWLARGAREVDPERAADFYEAAASQNREKPAIGLEAAEFLISIGRLAAAREIASHVEPSDTRERGRLDSIIALTGQQRPLTSAA